MQPASPTSGSGDAGRAAFTLAPVHARRDARRITAIALLRAGQRVFIGLDNGVVEEHRCTTTTTTAAAAAAGASPLRSGGGGGGVSTTGLGLRLLAEKRVFSRQAVADISPADAAGRLVCLSEEGGVALVSLETFAVVPLPAARGAVAVAAQAVGHLPVLLAVAVRAGKGRSKLLLFSVLPGATTTGSSGQPAVQVAQVPVPEAVLGLAWAGPALLLAVPGGYYTLRPVPTPAAGAAGASGGGGSVGYQLALLADHLASIRPLLGPVPDLGLCLMAWEGNMVLVADATGAAVREPLQLPLPPLALASAGLFVVVVCDDGVYVFDRSSSRQVQRIDFAHDDAYVGLSQRLPAAADAGGRCICLATSSQVLWLEPVALEQQVRELLKRKRYEQALDLICSSPTDPHSAPTTPAAGRGTRGGGGGGAAHTPSTGTAPAAAAAAAAAVAAAAAAVAGGGGPCWQQVALAQAGLLLLLDGDFEGGLGVLAELPPQVWQPCQLFALFPDLMASWISKVPARAYWALHGHRLPDLASLIHDAWELKLATTPRAPQQHHQHQQQQRAQGALPTSLSPVELQGLVQAAKAQVAAYLARVRTRPHLALPDGLDALLLALLCDVGDAAAAEALLAGRHAAPAGAAEAALRQARRWHGLALAQLRAGRHEEALGTWRALAAGELAEAPAPSGAVADASGDAAAVAVAAAAAAMADPGPDGVPLELLLPGGHLAWLLGRDAAASLAVLEARGDLPAGPVLALLQDCDLDLQWQYLYHQVYISGSTDQQLHSQLGTVLLKALAAHIATGPALDGSASSSSTGQQQQQQREQDLQQVSSADLVAMAHRLPLLFAPNTAPTAAADAAASRLDSSGQLWQQQQQQQLPHHHQQQQQQQPQHGAPLSRRHTGSIMAGSSSSSSMVPSASRLAASMHGLPRAGSSRLGGAWGLDGSSRPGGGITAAPDDSVSTQQQQQLQGMQQHDGRHDSVRHHNQQQQQQQQRVHGSLGALAGQLVQLQQQQQQHGMATSSVDHHPSAGMEHHHHQQQQHQQHGGAHGHTLSRGLSSVAELLLQQQHQQQRQQQRQGGSRAASVVGLQGAAPAAAARAAAARAAAGAAAGAGVPAGAGSRQVSGPLASLDEDGGGFGVYQGGSVLISATRALPAGYGPWPLPPAAAAGAQEGQDQEAAAAAAAAAADASPEPAHASTAAAAAVAGSVGGACRQRVLLLRCVLTHHLQASLLYDVEVLLPAVQALPLYPEQALLLSRAGHHAAVLLLLALLPPRLVQGAIAYCRALASQDAWLALLETFLNPGAALAQSPVPLRLAPGAAAAVAECPPDYADACMVLNAEGGGAASLDPLVLLRALPAGMPLHLAGGVLTRMLAGLQHRHRQGQVVRSLHRCRHLASHAELVALQCGRVLLGDDTACGGCGRLIGSTVFFRLPSGVVVCSRCSGAVGGLAAAAPWPPQ